MTADFIKDLFSERQLRRLRLVTGLIIFLFVLMHILNHSVGLISVGAAQEALPLFLGIWNNPIGMPLLYGSLLVHIGLALRALFIRRSLAMPKTEIAQVVLGLLIPLLIIEHVLATRVAFSVFHMKVNYETVIRGLWSISPVDGVKQCIALIVIWAHGCIGVHFWLRYRPWYPKIWPWALTLAIMLPILALLGFVQMGRTIANPTFPLSSFPGGAQDPASLPVGAAQQLWDLRVILYGGFAAMVIFVFAARGIRWLRERAHLVAIRYVTGEVISVPRGFTVLEASRLAGKPHYAVCGGKGRCSTCRVQIMDGEENLPPADAAEQRTLDRIQAGPGVRLACQLRPTTAVTLSPLLAALPDPQAITETYEAVPGREREIAVLFCDIRNFTTISESRLPFDIVFLLNRYFAVVGSAVEAAGGRVDKFIGDGAMALFGINGNLEDGCRQAVRAAANILDGIEDLNRQLSQDLTIPLRLAIGIHAGPAVVGTMGYGNARNLTAIGDTVNVASRLEGTAKELDMPLVISEPVATLSAVDLTFAETREIVVRGRTIPLRIFVFGKSVTGMLLQKTETRKPAAAASA